MSFRPWVVSVGTFQPNVGVGRRSVVLAVSRLGHRVISAKFQ